QTLNPVCFLFVPSFINLFGMFTDADVGNLPKLLSFLFALFPIINPILVIYFTEDYKRFVLGQATSFATQVLVFLLGLFPIFNPIIVILFTEDYKKYLLGQS
ncbi:hypothetical protein PENTCL1PPCAC_15482, partial [Pristionchus entomophagus]